MGAAALVEEKIRSLRDRFVIGLADRVANIDQELGHVAADGSAVGLGQHFHTLAGTAAMYGFDHIVDLASSGEELCRDQIVDARATQDLQSIVVRLRGAIAAEMPRQPLRLVPTGDLTTVETRIERFQFLRLVTGIETAAP